MLNRAKNSVQNQTSKRDSDKQNEDLGIPRIFNEPYFYGRITRQEAEDILTVNGKEDGLYLLRESITPMYNFSLSIAFRGNVVHYSIEKIFDGQYAIGNDTAFRDPLALIQHYQNHSNNLVAVPSIPCVRQHNQETIAFRGLSYNDLHSHMVSAAKSMNANIPQAIDHRREYLMLHVLHNMYERMPWYHGKIAREDGIIRLQKSGHEDGKFLVRMRTDNKTFALTMSCEQQMRHYFILMNDGETYSIENGPKFKALIILVDHYHNLQDGLPCKLTTPCTPPGLKQYVLENYLWLHKKLTQKCDSPNLAPHVLRHIPPKVAQKPPVMVPHRPAAPPVMTPDSLPPPLPIRAQSGLASCTNPPKCNRQKSVSVDNIDEEDSHSDSPLMSSEEAERLESDYIAIREDILSIDLRPEHITLQMKLGSGQFGDVRKGICRLYHKQIPVAVKTLKNNDPVGEKEILREANVMKKLDHHHIVRMIGVCKVGNIMLVMELASLGSLKKYLDNHLKMKVWHQTELILQICDAMTYLESMDIVHRDLATRNVLMVTEHFIKISDFGMSRMLDTNSDYYLAHVAGRWPLMWYAPECLYYHKFDSKSDVWSFGVTMWEIMSLGAKPYEKMKPQEIMRFIESGNRLPRPNNCDIRIYELMLFCWESKKEDRPDFKELRLTVDDLYREFERAKL